MDPIGFNQVNIVKNYKDVRFLLMYSPQRQNPRFGAVKPEGSLGIAYLAGALLRDNFDVDVLDCCVGNSRHSLEKTFYTHAELSNGMVRVGLEMEQIVNEVKDYDVIGISSIFTAQTKEVVSVVHWIKIAYPEKIVILGGVNARSQLDLFFNAGADIICTSESEGTIIEIGNYLRRGYTDFSDIRGIAFREAGKTLITAPPIIEDNLDNLPFPAYHKLPMDRYWEIARPHGGGFSTDKPVRYAPAMFSRGCWAKCSYCHISREGEGSIGGNTRKLRYKSHDRVLEEIRILKDMGVEYVFIEDDTLLANKKRVKEIFRSLIKFNLRLGDVNGINLAHLTTNENGKYGVDDELLELMREAGFEKLIFPVESGCQRIIDKYATGKLNLEKHDVPALIKKTTSLGIQIGGNYTFGYPDESRDEMMKTFFCALDHKAVGGRDYYVNFMCITPFPGTALYEQVVRDNLLLPGVEVDELDWTKPSIKTAVSPQFIEFLLTKGWEFLNDRDRIERIRSMAPK